jgi:flavin reductase (DIM6/NTAB) family NADH-FMN oxidoreductase RutF
LRESDSALKHSYLNLSASGEFVINVCSDSYATDHIETIAHEYPADVNEFTIVGWHTQESIKVAPPSVAEAPAHLECRVSEEIGLGRSAAQVAFVVAEVLAITFDERVLLDGDVDHPRVDGFALGAIGRAGGRTFVRCNEESVYYQERPPLPGADPSFLSQL